MSLISVVVPVYGCESCLLQLYSRLTTSIISITSDFEIILVNDASPDNSWDNIIQICKKDKRVKGINLSRNFGQHYAISAGIENAKGTWVVVMDCDLQDQPEEIIGLYEEAIKGYDIVIARRKNRQDSFFKKFFSNLFYKVLGYLTGTDQDPSVANFGIYHQKVIASICSMKEQIRYFPTMVRWVGFKKKFHDVKHAARKEGKTSYNYKKLVALALDILLANSEKPIRLIVKIGFLISTITLVAGIIVIIRYLSGAIAVAGYTSLVLSLWFLGGFIILVLGIIGLYISKIFQGVKNRPIFIISESINFDER